MSDMSQAPDQPAQAAPGPDPDAAQDKDEVCVEISINTKTGEVKYGLESDDPDTQDDDSNMQTAKSIDDAFVKAKALLQQAVGGQAQGAPAAQQSAFEQGFSGVAGKTASPY